MSKQRILVIDDDPNIAYLCRRILSPVFDIQSATRCEQGRSLLDRLHFDLVLLDLYLPDGQGLDVLNAIRESSPELPVIVITGHGTIDVVIDALHAGAQGFLIKPFDPRDLRDAVQRALEREQLRAENARLAARMPLLEVSKALMSETDLEPLAQLVLDTVRRELAADRVSLMLLDDAGQALTVAAALGLDKDTVSRTKIALGEGLAGHVAQTGEPRIVPSNGPDAQDLPASLLRSDAGSALCVPLLYHGKTIGVLFASRPLGTPSFQQDDLDLLVILGGQVAVAIENARLFEQAAHEIAERKQTEEALRRERDFVAAITDTVGALVVVLDRQGRIVRFNQACEQATGYTFEQARGRFVWDFLLPPEQIDTVKAVFEKLRAGHYPNQGENEWLTSDGARRLIAWANTALTDGNGRVEYVIGTGIDITERRRAQQALRESEERYRFLFESASVSLWEEDISELRRALNDLKDQGITDLRRYLDEHPEFVLQAASMIKVLDVNDMTLQMHGADDKAPFLGPLIKTLVPEALPTLKEDILAIAEGRSYIVKESVAQAVNGTRLDTLVSASIPLAMARHNTMLVGILDITQRRQVEEALRRSTERLGILHEIDQGILSAQSPAAIGQATLGKVRQLIPCLRATITVVDPLTDESVSLAVDADHETVVPAGSHIPHAPIDDQIAGLEDGHIAWWDVSPDQGSPFAQLYAEGVRSYASVPLLVQDQLVATLNLGFADRDTFTAEHQEIAFQIAGLLAIAIQQARLYEQVQQHASELEQRVRDRTQELRAMYDVIAIASRSLDLDATLEQSLDRVLRAIGGEIGAIHLLDPAGERLHLAVHRGIPKEMLDQLAELPTDEGLGARVIEHRRALVLPDVRAELLPAGASVTGPLVYVGVPMEASGRTLGVLSVLWETEQVPFGLEAIALLSSLTSRVASVVDSSQLRLLAEQAAVLRERQRLARELHDSVTQSLYSLNLLATTGQRALAEHDTDRASRYFDWMSETSQQALKEMRLLIYELRPPTLERDGLISALQQRLDAVEGRAGIETRLIVEGEGQLPEACEEAFYRIAIEALNNALKHAEATAVTIETRIDDRLAVLQIVDNGRGFDPAAVVDAGGMGLAAMRERADEIEGDLQIVSEPGQGTGVTIAVHCRKQADLGEPSS